MAQLYNNHDYYKKMLDLQEKLRKSEEERIRLEERFKVLVQESQNRHDACINRLRLRYIEFLEEQRARDERNHKLLGTLDRVDSSLALMTAKTDRLNTLRKQYEAHLLQAYRGPPGSTTGDSGIASQIEDRWSRRNISTRQFNSRSPELKSFSTSQIVQPDQHPASSLLKLNQLQPAHYPFNSRQIPDTVPLMTQSDTAIQKSSLGNENIPQMPRNFSFTSRRNSQSYSLSQNSFPQAHRSQLSFQETPNETFALNQQNLPPRNLSQTVQMDPIQMAPHLGLSEPTNGNVSRYKLSDASQHQLASSISQRVPSPLPIPQTYQYSSNRMLANNYKPQHKVTSSSQPFKIESRLRMGMPSPFVPSKNLTTSFDNSQDIRQTFRDLGVQSLTSAEIDEMIRRNEQQPKYTSSRRSVYNFSPLLRRPVQETKEDEVTASLEMELNRYIQKIRATQKEPDGQCFEELDHEQNTSGDLLNVSLSDDDLDLPVEDKPKDKLPDKVQKILALADDLASSTANQRDVKDSGRENSTENRSDQTEMVQGRVSAAKRGESELSNRQDLEPPVNLEQDEISNDTALLRTDLDQYENIEQSVKEDQVNIESEASNGLVGEIISSDVRTDKDTEGAVEQEISIKPGEEEEREVNGDLCAGAEAELELQSLSDLKELQPWDLKRVEKRVEEVQLEEEDKDQSTEKELVTDEGTNDSSAGQLEVLDLLDSSQHISEKLETKENAEEKQQSDTVSQLPVSELKFEGESKEDSNKNDSESIEKNQNEMAEPNAEGDIDNVDNVDNETVEEIRDATGKKDDNNGGNIEGEQALPQEQQYSEYPIQSDEYQQEYEYNETGQYEHTGDETYQEYANQEYADYTTEQYDQYEQYPNTEYQQDPSQEYQEYKQDEEYDPNEVYKVDSNETYQYTENDPYNTNQQQDNPHQDEIQIEEGKVEREKEETPPKDDTMEQKENAEGKEIQEELEGTSIPKKKKDVIRSLLDSDTDSTIERNVSNTDSDFDFN